MKSQPLPKFAASAAALLLSLGLVQDAAAVFKYLDENGRIVYSDRPPPPGAKSLQANTSGAGSALPDLPFALRGSVLKYPVTLYSLSSACAPCDDARAALKKRGIPFSEKQIRGNADVEAMKKAGLPAKDFPVITVGAQTQTSFRAETLDGLLDAAGYPKTSMLPSGYKHPSPTPAAGAGSKAELADASEKPAGHVIEKPATAADKLEADKAREERLKERRKLYSAPVQQAQSTIRF